MGKTTKTKKQQTQRPKGPGAKPPPRRVSPRVKKQAPTATELAASMAPPRCGQENCKVCNPQPCNNCRGCRFAVQTGRDIARQCNNARNAGNKQCPNVEKPEPKHARDPRNNDESSELYRASSEIIAKADDPSTASASQLVAVRA